MRSVQRLHLQRIDAGDRVTLTSLFLLWWIANINEMLMRAKTFLSQRHSQDFLMQRFVAFAAGILVLLSSSSSSFAERVSNPTPAAADERWIQLFNGKDLKGWSTFLQKQNKNEDPSKVFQVQNGAIHVYGNRSAGTVVPAGYLASDAEFANYHLRLEYKWGAKKFAPRDKQRRDAGLLYHVTAPDVIWPRCIECQIQENDTGDCFTVRGTQLSASIEMENIETPGGFKLLPRYKPEDRGGKQQTVGEGGIARIVKSSIHERDGWNMVELIIRGCDDTVHIVNGHTVFNGSDLRQLNAKNKSWEPLTHGRIALQAEFAEVFYRNVEIRPIPDHPLYHDADRPAATRDVTDSQLASPPQEN
jgi:hypothetical protein